jgi:hypothetical protein
MTESDYEKQQPKQFAKEDEDGVITSNAPVQPRSKSLERKDQPTAKVEKTNGTAKNDVVAQGRKMSAEQRAEKERLARQSKRKDTKEQPLVDILEIDG